MPDPTPATPETPEAPEAPAAPAADETPEAPKATPPWGDDADFDASRAWTLIQNLRAEVDGLKAKRPAKTEEPAADGDPAPAKDDPDLSARLTAAEERAQSAERELWRERALRKHKVPEDLADLIVGDSEEAVLAIAERLAKATGASGKDTPEAEAQTPPASKPEPTLTPGHGGEPIPTFDPSETAKAIRARR